MRRNVAGSLLLGMGQTADYGIGVSFMRRFLCWGGAEALSVDGATEFHELVEVCGCDDVEIAAEAAGA